MRRSVVSDITEEPAFDNNDTHLWMAVLDRAVRDLVALERYRQDPGVMDDPVFRYDYRTLRKWFISPAMEPGSFSWICSLVNIDPKWAIRRLEDKLGVGLTPDRSGAARRPLVDLTMVSPLAEAGLLDAMATAA
ncbi:MAG: hypothetical protein H7831_12915 [Magnetococcus sp. WYHC-3]